MFIINWTILHLVVCVFYHITNEMHQDITDEIR